MNTILTTTEVQDLEQDCQASIARDPKALVKVRPAVILALLEQVEDLKDEITCLENEVGELQNIIENNDYDE